MAEMTASLTRDKGTLEAMRSVLSSTAALSMECSSAKARSSDCVTSLRNSASASLLFSGSEVSEGAVSDPCSCPSYSLSLSEDSLGLSDVSESESDSTTSESSPGGKKM